MFLNKRLPNKSVTAVSKKSIFKALLLFTSTKAWNKQDKWNLNSRWFQFVRKTLASTNKQKVIRIFKFLMRNIQPIDPIQTKD